VRERRREGEKQTQRYADGQRDRDEADREDRQFERLGTIIIRLIQIGRT
jgi:hypothetical protein